MKDTDGSTVIKFIFVLFNLFSVSSAAQFTPAIDTSIVINTYYIYFDSGSYNLDSNAVSKLKSALREDTIYSYAITGHTDSDGSDSYNLKLSADRVASVATYLIDSLKFDSLKIITSFEGELKPVASNQNYDGKKLNRRVSIERFLPVKIRYLSGRINSDHDIPIEYGHIYMQSRYYRDSTSTDSIGRFKIAVPDNSFVRLNVSARNHFYIDTLLKISPKALPESLDILIPYLKSGQRYILPEMFFVGNRDVLLFRSLSSLSALTQTMINSDVCAIIEGHVNLPNQTPQPPGSFSFNLSVARAMKIRNHLIENGVDSTRINPLGFSNWYMDYPYAISEREQELNRRVEMVIKDCHTLFDFVQDDLIIPDKIGTSQRLVNIK